MDGRMNERHLDKIAGELNVRVQQVRATAELLAGGATVPFIARYRKEATGTLDEVAITAIRDRIEQLAELDKRREVILKSLEERNLLTDELRDKLNAAETMAVIEDIYLPFRPKRRTRATLAREKGLQPLADILFAQAPETKPEAEAGRYLNDEKGVEKIEDVQPGMRLPGIVTNVTAFGAFVDIGVHQDGLVHISQLAGRFVRNPGEVVKVHQKVMVTVIEVDLERKRIALSMRSKPTPQPSRGQGDKSAPRSDKASGRAARPQTPPTNTGWFSDAIPEIKRKPTR
jgi:transcriptional accessory protein Tex/SPT6